MADGTKVTRVKATEDAPKKVIKAKAPKKRVAKQSSKKNPVSKFFSPMTSYLKGSWSELKQVRWPSRKATWGLTLAVILFSAFFMGLITLLDSFFQFIFFELIIT